MKTTTLLISLAATLTLTSATPIPTGSSCGVPPVASPPAAAPPSSPSAPSGLTGLMATLLFNIDGNEALANFQLSVPGTRTVDKSMMGLAVSSVKGLQAGHDASDVVCQAWDADGNAIGERFGEGQVELDGGVKVVVGSVSCEVLEGGLGQGDVVRRV